MQSVAVSRARASYCCGVKSYCFNLFPWIVPTINSLRNGCKTAPPALGLADCGDSGSATRIRPSGSGRYQRSRGFGSVHGVCPDIGDLDADRTPIRDRRMPGRLFHVEGLVDRAVEVEHEMNAEPAPVLKDLEAAPAGAPGIEVDHELIDHPRQQRKVPSAAAYSFQFLAGQLLRPHSVADEAARSRFLGRSRGAGSSGANRGSTRYAS